MITLNPWQGIFPLIMAAVFPAGAYIIVKTVWLTRVLQTGTPKVQQGSIRALIRCLLGRGRTFHNRDIGAAYMLLLAIGAMAIGLTVAENLSSDMGRYRILASGLLSVFLAGSSALLILTFLIQRARIGYSMEICPLIALFAFAIARLLPFYSITEPYSQMALSVSVLAFVSAGFPHMAASLLNIYFQKREPAGKLETVKLEGNRVGAESVRDLPWKSLLDAQACASCGRCENACPAFIAGKPLSPRRVVRDIRLKTNRHLHATAPPNPCESLTDEDIWSCTLCLACVSVCPVYINHIDIIIDQRRRQVLDGKSVPSPMGNMLRNLELFGDNLGAGSGKRTESALKREIPLVSKHSESVKTLLWTGCYGAFHPQYQKTVQSLARILKTGGVDFKILGSQEQCCGDPARRLGKEDLFQKLAKENIERLRNAGIEKIITPCPHCFHTLKNEYIDLGGTITVQHAAEAVAGLIRDGKIQLKYAFTNKLFTIHDPCYLGRTNGIYNSLREIIQVLPEAQIVELPRNREGSFCCGGGGGQMWLHERDGQPLNRMRAAEIIATGAHTVATACPYCLSMLEDGIKGTDTEAGPKAIDLIDIVAWSM